MHKQMQWEEFSRTYCETQLMEPPRLLQILREQLEAYEPAGWALCRCEDLSSSRAGQHVIVVYGPRNTWKEPPAGVFSPRGLASDMSTVVGVLLVADLPTEAIA